MGEVHRPGHDVGLQLHAVLVEEGRDASTEQHVADHSKAPHVGLMAGVSTLDNLNNNRYKVCVPNNVRIRNIVSTISEILTFGSVQVLRQ